MDQRRDPLRWREVAPFLHQTQPTIGFAQILFRTNLELMQNEIVRRFSRLRFATILQW